MSRLLDQPEQAVCVNFSPSTHIIASIRARATGWIPAICELLDNSFDAGATSVKIHFNRDASTLDFEDDGHGVHPEQSAKLIQLGGSVHSGVRSVRLGRYGIGAKHAIVWAAGEASYTTRHSDGAWELSVNWDRLVKAANWDANRFEIAPDAPHYPKRTGLAIRMKSLRHGMPPKLQRDMVAEIGLRYAAAISAGRSIEVKVTHKGEEVTHRVAAYAPPAFSRTVEEAIEFDGGRVARVSAGLVEDIALNDVQGLRYVYGYRMIRKGREGCGDFSVEHLNGQVQLEGDWGLSDHKDDLTRDQDELYDAVQRALTPLLEAAAAMSRDSKLSEMEERLTRELQGSFDYVFGAAVRAGSTRDPEGQGVKPTGRGFRHKLADRIDPEGQPARRSRTKRSSGVNALVDYRVRLERINEVCVSHVSVRAPKAIVTLNTNSPRIARLVELGNEDALAEAALCSLAQHIDRHGLHGELFNADADTYDSLMFQLHARSV